MICIYIARGKNQLLKLTSIKFFFIKNFCTNKICIYIARAKTQLSKLTRIKFFFKNGADS